MSVSNDWNRKVIEEFRANAGKVGGMFEGSTILILHSKGAKSHKERVNPLAYFKDGGSFVVIASKAGAVSCFCAQISTVTRHRHRQVVQ